jgi:hypothetical protein
LQTDIPLKKRVNDTNFRNLVLSVQCSILKWLSLKVNACFGST